MKIYLGTDHAGFALKESVKAYLTEGGHEVIDCGAATFDKDDSYVTYVTKAVRQAVGDASSRAIVFGGSGQGEGIAANRVTGARAVVYYGPADAQTLDVSGSQGSHDGLDIIRLSRAHNNSNVLSLGARFITEEQAKAAVDAWLHEPFSNETRHAQRNKDLDAVQT